MLSSGATGLLLAGGLQQARGEPIVHEQYRCSLPCSDPLHHLTFILARCRPLVMITGAVQALLQSSATIDRARRAPPSSRQRDVRHRDENPVEGQRSLHLTDHVPPGASWRPAARHLGLRTEVAVTLPHDPSAPGIVAAEAPAPTPFPKGAGLPLFPASGLAATRSGGLFRAGLRDLPVGGLKITMSPGAIQQFLLPSVRPVPATPSSWRTWPPALRSITADVTATRSSTRSRRLARHPSPAPRSLRLQRSVHRKAAGGGPATGYRPRSTMEGATLRPGHRRGPGMPGLGP
jgi:hypothetical protein